MVEKCTICDLDIASHRNFVQLARYRNEQKLCMEERGVFCDHCARQLRANIDAILIEMTTAAKIGKT